MSYEEENRGFLTSSKLKTFLKCPNAYNLIETGVFKKPEEDSDSLIEGTAFHDYFYLGPQKWKEFYEILPPKKMRKGESGKIEITHSMGERITKALLETTRQPVFDAFGEYQHEEPLEIEWNGIKLRAKMDRINYKKRCIRDFKFFKTIKDFEWEAEKYEYYFQMAFYQFLVELKTGEIFDCYLDVVDKTENACSEVFLLDQTKLKQERMRIVAELTRFQHVSSNNSWLEESAKKGRCRKECPAYSMCENALQLTPTLLQ